MVKMKTIIFRREKVVKIRYNRDSELTRLINALTNLPEMEVVDRGYRG